VDDISHDPESKRDRRREVALRALDSLREQNFLRVENSQVVLVGAR
jgi:hypothetical protein